MYKQALCEKNVHKVRRIIMDADDLLLNYKVDGVPLKELWHEIDIIAM